jgi:DNA-binding MarR family transcriptional regulator
MTASEAIVKLSDSQFGTLHALAEHGPQEAVEVHGARGMDGKRKIKLEWRGASVTHLATLEDRGLVAVSRTDAPRPINAVGKVGHRRVALRITITPAGQRALTAA